MAECVPKEMLVDQFVVSRALRPVMYAVLELKHHGLSFDNYDITCQTCFVDVGFLESQKKQTHAKVMWWALWSGCICHSACWNY